MTSKLAGLLLIPLLFSCSQSEKEESEPTEQTFADFQESYFSGRQCEELEDACAQWYEDCVAAGHSEEDCGTRLDYCGEDGWEEQDCGDEEREDNDGNQSSSDCDEVAQEAYEECIAQDGASAEDCRERAARAYEECMERE